MLLREKKKSEYYIIHLLLLKKLNRDIMIKPFALFANKLLQILGMEAKPHISCFNNDNITCMSVSQNLKCPLYH